MLLCFRNTCMSPGIDMLWTEWGAMVEFLWAMVRKNQNRKWICLMELEQCCHRWVSRFRDFMCTVCVYSITETMFGHVPVFYMYPTKLPTTCAVHWIIGLQKNSDEELWQQCKSVMYLERITEQICVSMCMTTHECVCMCACSLSVGVLINLCVRVIGRLYFFYQRKALHVPVGTFICHV